MDPSVLCLKGFFLTTYFVINTYAVAIIPQIIVRRDETVQMAEWLGLHLKDGPN